MEKMRRLRMVAVAITAAVVIAGISWRVGAQDAGGGITKPTKMARDSDPDWEVATVKPSDPNDKNFFQHMAFRGRQVTFLDTTVEEFLLLGYGVQKSQLADEPDWAKTERWDVDGVPDVEGQPSWPQTQALMRKVLAERFGLKLHHEQRELPVFALRLAKGGPKMAVNASDPNGWMDQRNGEANGQHSERLKNTSMAELALILQFRLPRPVVDQTGLKGRYDFNLQWTIDEAKTTAPDAPPGLFTAIQEQMGLKLEPVKAPVEVLVVDAVSRPSAN